MQPHAFPAPGDPAAASGRAGRMTGTDQGPLVGRSEAANRRGDLLALFELARQGLEAEPDNARLRYLQTLALARLGEPEAALELYARHRIAEIGDEDAIALEGRILKDIAFHAPADRRAALLRQAGEAYANAYRQSSGYFSGINAATTLFLAGDEEDARRRAAEILARADIQAPRDYYAAATRAEALLLLGYADPAREAYRQAPELPGASPGARASTTRQVRLLANAMRMPEADRDHIVASVRPDPIIHFCGNMFRAGWAQEARIAADIARAIDELRPMAGYGALACGADILIAEALVARNAELHVVLPVAEDDFIAVSVACGGDEWARRYAVVRAKAASMVLASNMPFIGDEQQFAYGSQLAMGLARLRGDMLQSQTVQLAVWDGQTANRLAGTAVDVAKWRDAGGETRVVTIDPGRPPIAATTRTVATYSGPARSLRAIVFADFSGFSRLSEPDLPNFLRSVLGAIGVSLDSHADAVLCRNSWGDALFAIIADAPTAATIALDIQRALTPDRLREAGLPTEGGMRISLHFGPVYEDFDPVQRSPTFYGTEVTLAARIEPRVPVGAIYATQSFAAALAQSARPQIIMEYVGTVALAKNYGSQAIYRLDSRAPLE